MTKLRAPLKPLLDEPLSELELQRIWRKLQHGQRALSGQRRPSWQLLAAGCAGVAAAWFLLVPWLRPAEVPAPLALVDQTVLSSRSSFGGAHGQQLSLSDGSRIHLAEGAALAVVDNRGPSFGTRLERGRADFEVKPGGPRRWRVECGTLSVEVIGTQFSVERGELGVRVHVTHGVVAVRGSSVPSGLRKLVAGEALYVSSTPATAAVTRRSVEPNAPELRSVAAMQPSAAVPTAPPQLVPRALLEPASPVLPASAKPAGVPPRSSAEDRVGNQLSRMLLAADGARRAGELARARALLQQVIRVAPRGQYAAIAGLTLGRMLMQPYPERAAAALRAALAATPPADLREDIMVRLVEAEARAGQVERARTAAGAYAQAFPRGQRLAEVTRWVERP